MNKTTTEYQPCPNCGGTGHIPDMNSTAMNTTCPVCWGSKLIIKKVIVEETNYIENYIS